MDNFSFAIKSDKKAPCGILNCSTFDPSTILGDLIELVKESSCEEEWERLNMGFKSFFGACGTVDEAENCFEKLGELREYIINNSLFSITQFETVRSFYELKFSVQVSYENQLAGNRVHPIKPLLFGFSKIEQAIDNNLDMPKYYTYRCPSMIDIPFAILHYLLLHEYKFRKCEHCGKYFATKSLKQKYCTRTSPYKGYEHLSCDIAVDHIMKKIKQRRKFIMKYLYDFYNKAYTLFLDEYDSYNLTKTGELEKRSLETLKELQRITEKQYIKQKWYKEDYK